MPEPIVDDGDQDETVKTASGKEVVLPPPPGQSSALYNAEPADSKGNDSPYTTDFLKRFDPKSIDAASSNIETLTRQHIGEAAKADNLLNSRLEADRKQRQKAWDAEGAAADAIPPAWNADKESAARIRSPMENFGSIGAIFGILASQFTKTPLTSAMNAAAAAMNAQRGQDEEGYKTAYQAWKDNTALALKRFDLERDVFDDANKLATSDIQDWKIKTLQAAAQFDNQKVIAMLDAGLPPGEVIDYMDKYAGAADKMAKAAQDQEIIEERRQALTGLWQEQAQNNPQLFGQQGPDGKYSKPANPYKASVARNALMQAYQYDAKTPAEMDFKQWMIDQLTTKGSLDPKEMDEKVKALNKAGSVMAQAEGDLEERLYAQHLAAGDDPTVARKKAISEATQAKQSENAEISDDTAKLMATQYLAGDKTIFTNLGRGAQGAQNVVKVRNEITALAKEQGLKGQDLALRIAEFNGLVSGERALGTRAANVEMFAGEAYKMMDVARKASLDVPRGEWVSVNKALQAFEKQTGDPKIVAFGAAINTLVNTYAKAIAGGGQATVSDKDHARGMLEAAFSQAQFEAVLDTLGKELEAARAAPGMVKQGFRNLADQPKGLQGDMGPSPNILRYDADGNRIQ